VPVLFVLHVGVLLRTSALQLCGQTWGFCGRVCWPLHGPVYVLLKFVFRVCFDEVLHWVYIVMVAAWQEFSRLALQMSSAFCVRRYDAALVIP
jgi:hypothetical protein